MATRKSIVWGDIAKIQFKKINQYYYDNVGNTIFCEKLTKEVDHVLHLISENHFIGKPIPKTKFRSIIVYSYAIIYEIKDKEIYFLLFWDTHRDPEILKILLSELF
jgi:hypothetical protein